MTTLEKIAAISPAFIREQMQDFKIKNLRQLADATGINYISLTMGMSGKRSLSGEIKAIVYSHFVYLNAQNEIDKFNQ